MLRVTAITKKAEPELIVEYPQQRHHVPQKISPGSFVQSASSPSSSSQEEVPLLFQPFTVKDLVLPNRILVAPMCTDSSEDGFTSDFHLVNLGAWSLHGAGLIIMEATAVTEFGRITPGDVGLYRDEHVPGVKRIVDFVHNQGGKIGVQLAHAGRKASHKAGYTQHSADEFWPENVVGPSGGLLWDHNHHVPRELTVEEIQLIVKAFGTAAARAALAGMDTVEIHGAHGYLIHSFLSPVTNHRTDQYGGSLENRARFLLEVIQEVRENFPAEKPILLRVSATDYVEHLESPSWEIEQTVQIAKWVKEAGVDVFHVSSGGNTAQQKIKAFPGYQVPFAERVKSEVPGLHVVAVGLIKDGKQAEEVLQQERADLIAIGRGFLRDPSFTLQAARQLGLVAQHSVQYSRVQNNA
ncbi:hypothetical protein EMPS_08834 [Entomortierella parvispora]|uniref:NADH:flavin oxidoreductase/NADH oxidase N-terminal domain-containing protein n=1 Tax=Entomortierella parvispora TaxID=205924 RepID=A0A9P3HH62_9FUNG|nr:hypothetical protein EMPS_08834 [Entomortierella parvispora]